VWAKWLFLMVLIVGVGVGIYHWYSPEQKIPGQGYKPVKVERGRIVQSVEATGVIKPSVGAEVTIGARMSGIVVEEPVQVGDRVKQGALIARIDDRELKTALTIAEEELAKLREGGPKEIARLKSVVSRMDLALQEANITLEAARSDLDTAEWLYRKKQRLFEHQSGTEQEYKSAHNSYILKRTAWKSARNRYRQAEKSLEEAKLALEKSESDYRRNLAIAESKLKEARIRLSYSVIEAPFDGIVTYVSTQEGETVVAGMNAPKFVKILNPRAIENRIYIDETEIGRVKVGARVLFTVDAYPDRNFSGTIAQIYPQPELQNNIVYYIAVSKDFENAELLRPEMSTHDEVIVHVYKDLLRAPNRAVKFKNGHFFVYKKQGKNLEEVRVKTGISDSRFTEIVEGLSEGDTILMETGKSAH